jgi:membrane-associated protease RseP (regulator of RpoE activity)
MVALELSSSKLARMKPVWLVLALVWPLSAPAEANGKSPADAASQPAAATGDPTVVLEPMMVYGDTRLSFGFGIKVMRIEKTHLVLEMLVDRVQVGSEAERKGLKMGSKIVSIEGKDVAFYEATFVQGSELNRIFVDRPQGSSVTLQVLIPGKNKVQKVTIVRRSLHTELPKIGGLPD